MEVPYRCAVSKLIWPRGVHLRNRASAKLSLLCSQYHLSALADALQSYFCDTQLVGQGNIFDQLSKCLDSQCKDDIWRIVGL